MVACGHMAKDAITEIRGAAIAQEILDGVMRRARAVERCLERRPSVAVILVGNDAPSHLYVKLKQKAAHSVGIDFHVYRFDAEESQDVVVQALTFLVADDDVDAILIQMPLPDGFDADYLVRVMGAEKDVDGFHAQRIAAFVAGADGALPPVFSQALLTVARSAGGDLRGKRAALIVKSEKFGAVLAAACEREGLMPHIIPEQKLPCMQAATLAADVIFTAVGTPRLLSAKFIKNGAIVIDGGISSVDGATVGDVDVESLRAAKREVTLSPVPGGVGPVTIACLLDNVVTLAEHRAKR